MRTLYCIQQLLGTRSLRFWHGASMLLASRTAIYRSQIICLNSETPRFSPDIQAINFFQYFLTAKVALFMILKPVSDGNISPHSQCSVFGWVAQFAKTRQLYVSLSGCVGQPAGVWLGRHENRRRVPVFWTACKPTKMPLLGFCCRIYVESYRPLFASSAVSNKCRN